MTKEDIIKEIDQLVICLEKPLTPEEMKCRWNERAQRAWIEYFKRIKDDFVSGRIPEAALVAYGLDGSWGIMDGELFHTCCAVGEMVNDWLKERGLWKD